LATAWLQREFGVSLASQKKRNSSSQAAKWLKPIAPIVVPAYKAIVPATLRNRLTPLWRKASLMTPMAAHYGEFTLSPAVEDFIANYYRRDFALYQTALQEVNSGVA
jgi:hypothetical protein